jgi:hypothetical protein
MHRGPFREALTWLEIHGNAPEVLEHWRGFIEAAKTFERKAERRKPDAAPAAAPPAAPSGRPLLALRTEPRQEDTEAQRNLLSASP